MSLSPLLQATKTKVTQLWGAVPEEGRQERIQAVALALFDILPPKAISKEDRMLLVMLTGAGLAVDERKAQLARVETPRSMLMKSVLTGDAVQISMMYLTTLGLSLDSEYALGRLTDYLL